MTLDTAPRSKGGTARGSNRVRPAGEATTGRLLAIAVLAAACGNVSAAEGPAHDYACTGGVHLVAKFSPPGEEPGQVVLTFAGAPDPVTLPQAVSADGGRYVGDGIELWIKGKEATLTRNGTTETCRTK